MAYFPSGFWSRFITRLLADSTLFDIINDIYTFPPDIKNCARYSSMLGKDPQWSCWQSGIELKYHGLTLCRVKECLHRTGETFVDYRQCNLVMRMEDDPQWQPLDLENTAVLEILIPNQAMVLNKHSDNDEVLDLQGIYRTGSNMPSSCKSEKSTPSTKNSSATTPSPLTDIISEDVKTPGGALYRLNNGYPVMERRGKHTQYFRKI